MTHTRPHALPSYVARRQSLFPLALWLLGIGLQPGDLEAALHSLRPSGALSPTEAFYACTYLHCESAALAILEFGVSGPLKVWVNGVEVARESATKGKPVPASSRVFVQLRDGLNFVLVKLCGPGEPKFHAGVVGRDGKRVAGLTYRAPLDPSEPWEGLEWAHVGPFQCHREACVLDTKFPPELGVAGPPRDVSSRRRWQLGDIPAPTPSAALLNGEFEFVDEHGQPYAWRAMWGDLETTTGAGGEGRSLRFPPSTIPVTREVLSHPFVVSPRARATVGLEYEAIPVSGGRATGVAVSCSVQWLDEAFSVVGMMPVCALKAADVAKRGRRVEKRSVRPPFRAKFARVQLKCWRSRCEVAIDRVSCEVADGSD